MAEQVVEQVGLGQVVQLLGLAQPPGDGEPAMDQQVEKYVFVDQAIAWYQLPARSLLQAGGDVGKPWHMVRGQAQRVQACQVARVCTAFQEGALALEQRGPRCLVLIGVSIDGLGVEKGSRRHGKFSH